MKPILSQLVNFLAIIFLMSPVYAEHTTGKTTRRANNRTPVTLNYPSLVSSFYRISNQQLFWFSSGRQSQQLRTMLRNCIDSSENIGLNKSRYHDIDLIKDNELARSYDSSGLLQADMIFTDAAITFCKDVYQGAGISSWISSDDISPKFSEVDDKYILHKLCEAKSDTALEQIIHSLEPMDSEYVRLKQTLKEQIEKHSDDSIKQLSLSLNLFRWIHHFRLNEYIVVNVPSAELRYYQGDSLILTMKVVAGKPSTRTPRFAAYCNEIILYPYWNVPNKIAVNELLPIAKKSLVLLDLMNMQVLDNKGNILDINKIVWSSLNKNNFPYRFRQSTGCDNALGVIKFNLTSPYDVYMHDTNLKSAFLSGYRYYSHGCIRLEKPIELGNYLMNNKLDSSFLQSCLKNQVSIPVMLDRRVPVFVIYVPAEADNNSGKVRYYKDVYHLFH